jgi:hypothetical protein
MTTATLEAVKLTERINRIEPSATMAAVAEADKLRQQGIDVVDCTAGEPHFSTPQHITRLRNVITLILIPIIAAKRLLPPSAANTHFLMPFKFWSITAMRSFCRFRTGFPLKTSFAMRAGTAFCCNPMRRRDSALPPRWSPV